MNADIGECRILRDAYGRTIDYLRISVTDRCNLRCTYCMPPEGIALISHAEVLRYEEILRIARLSIQLGIRKIRLTGGEPLVRKGLVDFVGALAALDERITLVLTTNGVLLSSHAHALKEAGLQRVNISLDTLNAEQFKRITGFDHFHRVMEGMEAAVSVGLVPLKINAVLMRGVNEDELIDFVRLTREHPYEVRFIEWMPFSGPAYTPDRYLSSEEARARIEQEVHLEPLPRDGAGDPTRIYRASGHRGRIGFIEPFSSCFCGRCNRIRLTSDGFLKSCLLSEDEVDIKNPLRSGATDEQLLGILRAAILSKPAGHGFGGEQPAPVSRRGMSQIGG